MASDEFEFREWVITTNYGPLGLPSHQSPEESPRSALSDRSWAHGVHHDREEEEEAAAAEPSQTVAAGSNRTRDLEMIADHAGVDAPADLIALAYDRNDGDIVNTIMDLTEPISRRRLERELAERQAEAAEQDTQERARNGLLYTMERFRRLVTPAQVEEEQEDDFEEDLQAYQRELDLWLLESQVPGCTRERAERAYEQGQQDVARALPLARMATLLGDRECMVAFLMEQLPGSTRLEASSCYDAEGEDVVEAVIALHRRTQQRLNQPVLGPRGKQRLRIRTVFMLALLYREWYGQLEQEAEEALARVPIEGRWRLGSQPSFRTPDGSVWTHTRQEGWERRAPLTPASLGRAVRATEQLADVAEARGQAQMAIRARQTAADLREQLSNGGDSATNPPSPQSPLPAPVLRRSDERATLVHTPDGLERYTTVVLQTPHHENHLQARARGPAFTRDYGPEDLERWHDWDPSVDASDADDNGGDEDDQQPPTLAADSSSSSSAEEDDDDENERPTAGTYARPRPFVRSVVRVHPREAFNCLVKNELRTIQEQLDTEMANAAQGVVMSEGAYLTMMNAVKVLWEAVDPRPAEVN